MKNGADPTYRRIVAILFAFALLCVPSIRVHAQSADQTTETSLAVLTLMPQAADERLRSLLPQVEDPEMQQILEDPRLIVYTNEEMPPAYQDWDGGLPGLHSVHYNISADPNEPYGNTNLEFPWGRPAGTHRTKNVSSFRFIWLPVDREGQTLPIVWYRKQFPRDSALGYAWIFPVGSVVGEVLKLRAPDGAEYVFELRVRKREYGEWTVDVFRPFPTAANLAAAIKRVRPTWRDQSELAKLVGHLEAPNEMKKHSLADNHPRQAFKQSMGIDSLPPAGDNELVAELLTETRFKSALGGVWKHASNELHTCAPTTTASFHIVPANYDAGFIEVDRVSCMRCHETVGQHARDFEFGRDWYGRVRGSDGIFSFHPFDPGSISPNGFGRPVRMRSELLEAKVLEKFSPSKHSSEFYQLLEQQRRSDFETSS